MLKPEIKQKWLEALRSNQYPQGKEALRKTEIMSSDTVNMKLPIDCFCCLGVLCDVSQVGSWSRTNGEEWHYHEGDDRSNDYPPVTIVDAVLAEGIEVESIAEEGIKVAELVDPKGFVAAVQALYPRKSINVVENSRVFECLATLNDNGVTFEQIADVIEQYL